MATSSHSLVLPDPAQVGAWRPRGLLLLACVSMITGAFGPWLAGKFSGDSAGVTLGGDGWILVLAAVLAVVPVLLGAVRGAIGVWALLNAAIGAWVSLTHVQQAHMDGLRSGWGLYVGVAGCVTLAFAGLQWVRAASRRA